MPEGKVQEPLVDETVQNSSPTAEGKKLVIVLKFLSMWLGSILILVAIALLSNIEWSRKHIETALSSSFHRQVRLGKLSWSFGLHGLAIDSNRFEMQEKDGTNFIKSGPSEIGIALLPLIEKRLVVKHLEFKSPEVWATKISDKVWNFSDLIAEGPDIRMLQIENGKLHLRNLRPEHGPSASSEQNWESFEFDDLKLSLTLPRSNKKWPVFLSCKIPMKNSEGKTYKTSVDLSLTGKGAWEKWKENEYSLELKLKDFDPNKFKPLTARLPEMKGLIDLELSGRGIFDHGIEAKLDLSACNLSLTTARAKELAIAKVRTSAILSVNPNLLSWRDLKLSMDKWQLESNGKLLDWQKDNLSYEAGIGGKLGDLKEFFYKVIACFLDEKDLPNTEMAKESLEKIASLEKIGGPAKPSGGQARISGGAAETSVGADKISVLSSKLAELPGRLSKTPGGATQSPVGVIQTSSVRGKSPSGLAEAKLGGKQASSSAEAAGNASIELQLKGNKSAHSLSTKIKAEGIPLAQLIDNELGDSLVSTLKVDPKVLISGEFRISPERRLDITNLEIPVEGSKVKLSGYVDLKSNDTKFEFEAGSLSFDSFKKHIASENAIVKAICEGGPKSPAYRISGNLDIKGEYSCKGKQVELNLDSKLRGLKLTRIASSSPSCREIKGQLSYKNGRLWIKDLSGITCGAESKAGDFKINGYYDFPEATALARARKQNFDFDLRAHELSVPQLKDWLARFGVGVSEQGLDKLSGDVQELKAKLGPRGVSFVLNPSDLQVNLSNGQQYHLSSGSITFDNNEFDAREVVLQSKAGKLTFDAKMHGGINSLKLSSARFSTDGFELADLHSMIRANLGAGKKGAGLAPSGSSSQSQAFDASQSLQAQSPVARSASLPSFLVPSGSGVLHGKVFGQMQINFVGEEFSLSGVAGFYNASGRFGKTHVYVEKLNGLAVVSKNQIVFQETGGQMGKSTFTFDGAINDYSSADASSWQGQLKGNFYPEELDKIMDNLGHGIALGSKSKEGLNLRVTGSGQRGSTTLTFAGKAGSNHGLNLKTAFGTFHQPQERTLAFKGGLLLDEAKAELKLSNFQLNCGNEQFLSSGSFKWADESAEKPASLSFSLNTPAAVKASTLTEMIAPVKTKDLNLAGASQLKLSVEGPINDLALSGFVVFDRVAVPTLKVEYLSGRLDFPGWHFCRAEQQAPSFAKMQLKTVSLNGIMLHDIDSAISIEQGSIYRFKDCQALMSGGKLSMSGSYNTDKQSYHLDVKGSKLVVDEMVKDLLDRSGGVSGLADISFSLDNAGGPDSLRNLKGKGHFNIYQGAVASFGKLQEKLTGANLLQQGIFGFNVNNLLQAMMPVKSGQFNEISGELVLGEGNLYLEQLRFEGNNLRMRAAGRFDYVDRFMDLDVAGDIPRVSSSLIPGAIGEMSRKVTLQRMFSIVTFKKLKDLPSLPILGDIANNDPRAFAFSAKTTTEPPKLITQSVEKSFKWLPNKPFASAHPVPGI